MYFEADLKGKKYKIEVTETKSNWNVHMMTDDGLNEKHVISKKDYMELDGAISFLFEDSSYMVDVTGNGVNYTVFTRGSYREIPIYNDEALLHESLKGAGAMGGGKTIVAGMPGKIVKVYVKPGQEVKERQPVLVMEAMKMENEIKASGNLKVKEVLVKPGQSVESGATLVTFE
ncbi:MAG: acetyl-CoA carboxylase biotin carboxyl carrier protein subunit [Bdellovibrionales bacterium]|nr:acetyl-CoA carboxylase biotin carboxyl carrier protein subunit [Bdellovibrionales bacterium]